MKMLKKTFLLTSFLLFLAGSSSADFLDDFRAASRLRQNRKHQAAAEAYEKLGKGQKDANLADLCYLHASESLAAGRKFDAALEAANAIRDPSIREYARMQAFHVCGKIRQLRETFKDTDISKWPDQYAYLGYYMRGMATRSDQGIRDLELALAGAGSDTLARDAARRYLAEKLIQLKKIDQAHAVLDQLIATGFKESASYMAGVRAKALLLAQEKKFEAADKMLALIDRKGDWKKNQYFWFLLTKARIETAKGHLDAAEKLYDEAFAQKGISPGTLSSQKKEAAGTFPKYKEKK